MKIKDISELRQKLKLGLVKEQEFENVELKRGWTKEYGEKASMLCNAQPNNTCFMVVGIEDGGQPSQHSERWLADNLEKLSQQVNHFLDPSITAIDLTTDDIDGSKIVIITLLNPGVVVRWDNKAFSGGGTTKKRLNDEEILALSLSLPGITDLTKKECDYTPSQSAVDLFCREIGEESSTQILDKYLIRTNVAGKLLVGGADYRFVKHDLNGNLICNETRRDLLTVLSESTRSEIREFYSSYGIETSRITDELLRESLGNCVAHAAYQERNGEIAIELFPDRLVISNLAYSEYTSLANKWFSSSHKSPNPFLMETLRFLGKVDELGRGKKKLFQECLVNGLSLPVVNVSDAARHKRWSLTIAFDMNDKWHELLREQLYIYYRSNKEKALIAYALILWSAKPFSEIASHFDKYESEIAAEIIEDVRGPLFFYKEKDKLLLHRWVKVLLKEGKASKGFSAQEESRLFKVCECLSNDYEDGLIKTAQLREYAHLSDSPSDKTLASKTLNNWVEQGKIEKVKRGIYKFKKPTRSKSTESELEAVKKAFADIISKVI